MLDVMPYIDPVIKVVSAPKKVIAFFTGFISEGHTGKVLSSYHHLVSHRLRDISTRLASGGFKELSRKDFDPLALACSQTVATFLNKDYKDIQCTIKVCCPPEGKKKMVEVVTAGRSNQNSRPNETGTKKHYIHKNTSFCALIGASDGKTKWSFCLPYFYVQNFSFYRNKFRCSRPEYRKYYRTTMVYPLRTVEDGHVTIYGFLTFDSMKISSFWFNGLIETTEKSHLNWNRYQKAVSSSPLLNLCGSLADNITSVLYPHIRDRGTRK